MAAEADSPCALDADFCSLPGRYVPRAIFASGLSLAGMVTHSRRQGAGTRGR